MRILFLGRHYTYFRNFESVIAMLAERGHAVHAAVEHSDALGGRAMIEALAARFPGRVTFSTISATSTRCTTTHCGCASAPRSGRRTCSSA